MSHGINMLAYSSSQSSYICVYYILPSIHRSRCAQFVERELWRFHLRETKWKKEESAHHGSKLQHQEYCCWIYLSQFTLVLFIKVAQSFRHDVCGEKETMVSHDSLQQPGTLIMPRSDLAFSTSNVASSHCLTDDHPTRKLSLYTPTRIHSKR